LARLVVDSLEDLRGVSRVLVVGVGGGGDSLGALILYHKLKALGPRPLPRPRAIGAGCER
jgi:hypothetical protein